MDQWLFGNIHTSNGFGIICVAFAAPYTEQYILENRNQLQDTAWEILGTVFDGKAVIFSQIFFFPASVLLAQSLRWLRQLTCPNPFLPGVFL